MNKNKIQKFNYKLKSLYIEKLKGINDLTLEFDDRNVTCIVGANGSGKSTILHALACVFKPKGNYSAKDYNRLSDFFTPNKDASWDGSSFLIEFEFEEFNPKQKLKQRVSYKEEYFKKPNKHQSRWLPIYARRHERNSHYIGLQDLSTLNEDKNAVRYKEYTTEQLEHKYSEKIKNDMAFILGKEYQKLNDCIVNKNGKIEKIKGLKFNDIEYSELSMGAGEKRVLNVLYSLHDPSLSSGGLLLIDELDVLLHEAAFKNLVSVILRCSKEYNIEVVFSTHRETIVDFKDSINICGILNTKNKTLCLPSTNPKIIHELTGRNEKEFEIYVEDEMAKELVVNLLYQKQVASYFHVGIFGAYSNAFSVLAGKHLMGIGIENTLCVLDGDVCRSDSEKRTNLKRTLNGNDKEEIRELALSNVVEFKILHDAPKGHTGRPEYNIKKIFESYEINDPLLKDLQYYSQRIIGKNDWHSYFDDLVTASNVVMARSEIIKYFQCQPEWYEFVKEVSDWIDKKVPTGISITPVDNSPQNLKENILLKFPCLSDFKRFWNENATKSAINILDDYKVDHESLRDKYDRSYDLYDLICHHVYGGKLKTRDERIDTIKNSNYLIEYTGIADLYLNALLDEYGDGGIDSIDDERAFRSKRVLNIGRSIEIAKKGFGGKDSHRKEILKLRFALYQDT